MHIILFSHPNFLNSQSMPRFATMIQTGMHERGHIIESWTAKPIFYKIPAPQKIKKWLGYIDQYIIFPIKVKWKVRNLSTDILFLFSDQALGPWVPLVASRPHIIHTHDFMALRSALGHFAQNPTSWTGRLYQYFIRRGFGKGKNFISVSENTRNDLHHFLPQKPKISDVIYNGLNFPYHHMDRTECENALRSSGFTLPPNGFLLHVGGNQWYKNREGVIEIYLEYSKNTKNPLPLWMIGDPPTENIKKIAQKANGTAEIRFITGLSNEQLCAAYSTARLLLFPSLAEGFGWPIAEAMSCGCLVLTTNQAPMTEVGGNAAFYIQPKPILDQEDWAVQSARHISDILSLSADETYARQKEGYKQVKKFDTKKTLDAYEFIYKKVARGVQ